MFLRLKAPAVSDGNNFGVEVQNYVLTELAAMREKIESMVVAGRDYYWTRGQGLEKVLGDDKTSTSQKEDVSSDKDGDGKVTEKKSTSTSKSSSQETKAAFPDYKEYVVCVDVRQYHLAFNHLTDLRNSYLKAHVLFARNMKKLADPRGEGDGSSRNVMSMF